MNSVTLEELKIEGAKFPATLDPVLRARLDTVQLVCLVIGLIALGATAFGAFVERTQFFFSYLYAYEFWLGLSLGCFLLIMIHNLTGGRWGYPTRRFFEAGAMVLPLMLVLFIPVFFGLHELYPWARPAEVAADHTLRERQVYENVPAYIIRAVFFIGVWILISQLLRKWSLRQDNTTESAPTRKARTLSGPGIVIYALLGTFAYVDWIMALEKHWFSTMFAVIVIIGQILLALTFGVMLLTWCRRYEPMAQVVNKAQYHQLGNLLLAFVMFWTYVSFGQLLIIYSGDKPEELEWYLHRIAGHWKVVLGVVAAFHFFVPFYLLLFRAVKKHVVPITVVAAVLFVMHIVDTYWLIMPSFHQSGLAVSWLDFTAPVGIGGLWAAFFFWRLKSAPLLPQHDPGLMFAFRYDV